MFVIQENHLSVRRASPGVGTSLGEGDGAGVGTADDSVTS